ncbi:hypothetical protein OIV83_002071 [Microbotryomycetes sp. JL201]|nr:hypothetical protein OIV83_002071 [Microbotryomycetes sp. JL201]
MYATLNAEALENELVLVTGANGFVGTAVALEFLVAGYKNKHAKYSDRIEWVTVEDIAAPGAFNEAVKDVTIVVHTASPFHYNIKDNENDMLKPAIAGTRNMLEACASDKGSKIKRVVITSSFAAVIDLNKDRAVDTTYSHETWNPVTYEEAVKSDDPTLVYFASKKLAEEAAWTFVKENKVNFSLATLCPPLILGPPKQVVTDLGSLNTSSGAIWALVDATEVPDTPFPVVTDVRDVAKTHFLAATRPEAAGQRYLTIAHHFDNTNVAEIVRKHFPEHAHRIPNVETRSVSHYKTDSSLIEKHFNFEWFPLDRTIVDTARELFDFEKSLK